MKSVFNSVELICLLGSLTYGGVRGWEFTTPPTRFLKFFCVYLILVECILLQIILKKGVRMFSWTILD